MSDEEIDLFDLTTDEDVYEGEVVSTIEVTETVYSMMNRQYMPQVLISLRYPTGYIDLRIPMFSTDLWNSGLEQVRRLDRENTYGPEIHAIYRSTQDTPWTRVVRTPGKKRSGRGFIEMYELDSEEIEDDEEVIWDAEWESTTDPLNDIELHDRDTSSDSGIRCRRPWEDYDE